MAKVFYGNQYVGSVTVTGEVSARKSKGGIEARINRFWTRVKEITTDVLVYVGNLIKKAIIVLGVVNIAMWIAYGGVQYGKSMVLPPEAHANVVVAPIDYPVLDRIADCESGIRDIKTHNVRAIKGSAMQFDKNGQVRMNANGNKTVDMGYMQINVTVWGKTATDMGYNLTVEKDNKAFGQWLYFTKGTEPWKFSKDCWSY